MSLLLLKDYINTYIDAHHKDSRLTNSNGKYDKNSDTFLITDIVSLELAEKAVKQPILYTFDRYQIIRCVRTAIINHNKILEAKREKDEKLAYIINRAQEGDIESIFAVVDHYMSKGDLEKVEYYYLIGFEKDCPVCAFYLAEHHMLLGDYDKMIKYNIASYKLGMEEAIFELTNYFNNERNILQLYLVLLENDIIDIPHYIKNNHTVTKYINKCKFMSKESDCAVCIETKQCIPLECCHYFCIDCYPKVLETEKCPICRCDI